VHEPGLCGAREDPTGHAKAQRRLGYVRRGLLRHYTVVSGPERAGGSYHGMWALQVAPRSRASGVADREQCQPKHRAEFMADCMSLQTR
jgi:hypothetical protein